MEFNHTSVLMEQVIEGLRIKSDGTYIDGTLGGAGHGREICKALQKKGTFIGVDRDLEALRAGEKNLFAYDCNKIFVHSNYSEVKSILSTLDIQFIDGALLDLGVSSYQLDNPQRGFSYMQDAPLDMRMNQNDKFTAYDVVNKYTEKQLTEVIKNYGEEKWANRISKFIVRERITGNIETTGNLVEIIKKAIPAAARRDGPHPAKRTFQAIRIEVNGEIEKLSQAVEDFCDILAPGGRLCIITFHSLEDRIVKEIFARRANPCICPPALPICACGKEADIQKITGKPIIAGDEEIKNNPRARSAKLRVAEKRT